MKKLPLDLFTLYEKSVMSPDADLDFMRKLFFKKFGYYPKSFREDFCQTAYLASEWVRMGKTHTAIGVDLNPHALEWAKKFNLGRLGKDAKRVSLIRENVLKLKKPRVDFSCALNFSFFIFKERADLKAYFQAAHRGLKAKGAFFLDIMGGPDSQCASQDRFRVGKFTYIWDQVDFNPITHELMCYIHFKLPDGKMIKRAFAYDWRLWTVPEIKDLLLESGFRDVLVYWEDENARGYGTGTFRQRKKPENSDAWIAYIVAIK